MSYKLKNPMHVPPGGYVYTQPETGEVFDGRSLGGTVQLVFMHRQANGLPRPNTMDVSDDIQDQICKRVGHEWCEHMKVGQWGFSVGWDTIQSGTKALMAWAVAAVKGENPYVDQAEADRRAEICSKCWANKIIPGCAGCGLMDQVRKMLVEAKGERSTRYDDKLAACLVCGCANAAQVWVKPELLSGAMSDRQREAYAEIPDCWKTNLPT